MIGHGRVVMLEEEQPYQVCDADLPHVIKIAWPIVFKV